MRLIGAGSPLAALGARSNVVDPAAYRRRQEQIARRRRKIARRKAAASRRPRPALRPAQAPAGARLLARRRRAAALAARRRALLFARRRRLVVAVRRGRLRFRALRKRRRAAFRLIRRFAARRKRLLAVAAAAAAAGQTEQAAKATAAAARVAKAIQKAKSIAAAAAVEAGNVQKATEAAQAEATKTPLPTEAPEGAEAEEGAEEEAPPEEAEAEEGAEEEAPPEEAEAEEGAEADEGGEEKPQDEDATEEEAAETAAFEAQLGALAYDHNDEFAAWEADALDGFDGFWSKLKQHIGLKTILKVAAGGVPFLSTTGIVKLAPHLFRVGRFVARSPLLKNVLKTVGTALPGGLLGRIALEAGASMAQQILAARKGSGAVREAAAGVEGGATSLPPRDYRAADVGATLRRLVAAGPVRARIAQQLIRSGVPAPVATHVVTSKQTRFSPLCPSTAELRRIAALATVVVEAGERADDIEEEAFFGTPFRGRRAAA